MGKVETWQIFNEAKELDGNPEITVIVTPDMAQKMLDTMGRNRDFMPSVASRYARDMKQGRWKLSTNPICFDKDGHLIDGQHRLSAVISTGLSEPFKVSFDVDRETPIDIQKQRSTADNLVISGMISNEIGTRNNFAVVNSMIKIRANGSISNSLSDYDKGHILQKYSGPISLACKLTLLGKQKRILRKSTVQASIASALIAGYNEKTMEDFCRSANSGLPVGENPTPALVAARMIKDIKLTRKQLSSVVEQALLDCTSGKSRQKNYNINGSLPYSGKLTLDDLLS